MWVLFSLLGVFSLLIGAISVPVYGRITYDGALSVRIRVLGIPFTILPQEKTEKKERPAPAGSLLS